MKAQQHISSARQGALTIVKRETDAGPYWAGYATTPRGVVGVYQQISNTKPDADFTQLIVCRDGQEYTQTFYRFYQPRHVLTLAKRFAEEIDSHKGFEQRI